MKKPSVQPLAPVDAISDAKAKTAIMVEVVTALQMTFANNAYLVYGRDPLESIPPSRAASAFTDLQVANFGWGLIRLMSLWDRAATDRACIPTVAVRLQSPAVRTALHADHAQSWKRLEMDAAYIEAKLGMLDRLISRSLSWVSRTEASGRLESLRQYRDAFIAHNLPPPAKYTSPVYGQELRLMRSTTTLVSWLELILNNQDRGLKLEARRAASAATDLWSNTVYTIVDQSTAAIRERNRKARLASRAP